MSYTPTKITLTRQTGFSEDAARALAELAKARDEDPRELASRLLVDAIARLKPPSLREQVEGLLERLEVIPADSQFWPTLAGREQ